MLGGVKIPLIMNFTMMCAPVTTLSPDVIRQGRCGCSYLCITVTEMTDRQKRAVIKFPNELEVEITRDFDAPINLVFDCFTKPEHLSKTFAPFGEEVTVCSIDLRVGGDYHIVMVTNDGVECSFRGTYLEVEPPTRTVETWRFEGWSDVEAVESIELRATKTGTELTWKLAFRDQYGRDHMRNFNGVESNFDNVENYLRSLLD
jgi:uncharacterized protein YndB with AHSA1/START domain